MTQPIPLSAKFRHVVFPGEVNRRKKVINVAAACDSPTLPAGEMPDLSEENASFLRWLFAQAGLDVCQYRVETLQRRLPACLRALRVRSPAQARRLLEQSPPVIPTALSAMLVGVTMFFRDPSVFDMLRQQVLPVLTRGRTGVQVWSVGCSDGAELYSIALLLAEMNLLTGSYLLGTDCRCEAISRARAGCYDLEAIKNVPAPLRQRYFLPQASFWQLLPGLRAAVRWRIADILKTHEPGVWDLILCRNTTIYLRPEAIASLWEQFENALRPGGILVLGRAERPLGAKRLSLLGPCLYRRSRG